MRRMATCHPDRTNAARGLCGQCYGKVPRNRASGFLARNPDCTSTIGELEALYAASIDATTGLPGTIGKGRADLVLDHIPNGPAIGFVPRQMNLICTVWLDDDYNLNTYLKYRLLRLAAPTRRMRHTRPEHKC